MNNPPVSDASLDELRAFAAVFESGSFTKAARRLSLSTNAVSLRVQKLEETLGVRLLLRTTRSVTPTDEGRGFYPRIAALLSEFEAAVEELRPEAGGLRGTVRISMPGSMALPSLLEAQRDLLDANPQLVILTHVGTAPANIAAEGLDIAVVIGQPPSSNFVGRLLGRVHWVLAAAPSYLERHGRPRTPRDLARHRCLRALSHPPQDQWTLVDAKGRQVTIAVGGGYELDDSRALGDATYAGIGIGIRPADECQRAEEDGRLERVLPSYRFQAIEVYALLPKGRIRIPRVAACLEALRAVFGAQS